MSKTGLDTPAAPNQPRFDNDRLWWTLVGLTETFVSARGCRILAVRMFYARSSEIVASYECGWPDVSSEPSAGFSCRIPGRHDHWATFLWKNLGSESVSMSDDTVVAQLIERIGYLAKTELGGQELSPTEHKVYELLTKQLSEREIAASLDRSRHTIHVHVKSIYRKLAVNSRPELLSKA